MDRSRMSSRNSCRVCEVSYLTQKALRNCTIISTPQQGKRRRHVLRDGGGVGTQGPSALATTRGASHCT